MRFVALLVLLTACVGDPPSYSDTVPGEVVPGGQDFSALDALLDEELDAGRLHGFAMQIVDAEGQLVHRREEGVCAPDSSCGTGDPEFTVSLVTGIASTSKWVTSTVILAALDAEVEAGRLASVAEGLDRPVVPDLDCVVAGPVTEITLRQLLSFTSGVIANHDCTKSNATLQDCACTLLTDSEAAMTEGPPSDQGARTLAHPPGTTYKYGASHHAVAGAWVEAHTGSSWDDLLGRYVLTPAGADIVYRRETNLAGSAAASTVDFTRFVNSARADSAALAAGDPSSAILLSLEAAAEQRAAQVPESAVALLVPANEAEYGLNVWRYCLAPFDEEDALGSLDRLRGLVDPDCDNIIQFGHGGKGGYIPFMDAEGRYAAVLSIREDSPGGGEQYTEAQLALATRVRMLVHLAMVE